LSPNEAWFEGGTSTRELDKLDSVGVTKTGALRDESQDWLDLFGEALHHAREEVDGWPT